MARKGAKRLNPLKVSDGFRSFVLDQLEGLDDLYARSMFGGVGLYCDGLFFGIIAGDELYLKTDAANRPDYDRAGAKPFTPYPGREGAMKYYSVPLDVLESEHELVKWARKAVAAAAGIASTPSGRRSRSRSPRARSKR